MSADDPARASAAAESAGVCRATEAGEALTLVDGTRLRLRPIDAGDRDALAALLARLTPESRRRRFLSPKRELSARELDYFTDVDHIGHEAIVAVDEADGSIVGEARYAGFPGQGGVADFAIVVADELQHMGLGTTLAVRAVERARVGGLTRLTARTLWENAPARALLWRLGFRARGSAGHEIELELVLRRPRTRDRGPLGLVASL